MKSPLMSAKERTKAKFEHLVKAALEDAKLNAISSHKSTSAVSRSTAAESNTESVQRELRPTSNETDFDASSSSDVLNLTVPTRKIRKKDQERNGLFNYAFEDNNVFVDKSLGDGNRKADELANPSTSIPIKPKRKQKRIPERNNISNGFGENETQNGFSHEMVNVRPEVAAVSEEGLRSCETSLNGEANDAVIQPIPKVEIVRETSQPAKYRTDDPVSKTLEDSQSSHSKGKEHRRRRRQIRAEKAEREEEPSAVTSGELRTSEDSAVQVDEDAGNVFGVIVHCTDRLKMNFKIKHPVVQVHVIDGVTGTYLKKSRKDKAVTAVYENRNANVDYIMQVMTQPCDLKLGRLLFPIWEETLVYNESFRHFTGQDSNVIIFFEVLDFLPMSYVNARSSNSRQTAGSWYRIAWAFLKVVGANGTLNCDRKLQLQLYCVPKQRIRPEQRVLDIYHWWSQLPRIPYPATLYVTLATLSPQKALSPALRSMVVTQEERSIRDHTDDANSSTFLQGLVQVKVGNSGSVVHWTRLPGQACKVPNRKILSLPTAKRGCFVAVFSGDGRWIACGCQNETVSLILVYEVLSGSLRSTLQGHTGLIYDLSWSKSSEVLLSASADGTARTWDPFKSKLTDAERLMPHPSFVYCANFHTHFDSVVVTGCYDSLIRIWTIGKSDKNCRLRQELEGHRGHVNTLCFNPQGSKLLSGDSAGVVCVWNVTKHLGSEGDKMGDWTLCSEIKDQESRMRMPITLLAHHPNSIRVLVQSCGGSSIRMLDYEKNHVTQRYKGCLNLREHLRGCVSPCGSLIFAGGEDGCVHVWNSITGDVVSTYNNSPHHQTVRCVAYHPHDHMVAFCHHGSNIPVAIYKYVVPEGEGQDRVQQLQPSRVVTSTPLKTDANKRFVSFNYTRTTRTSTASTCLEKIMSKLDSILKAPTDEESLEATSKTLNSTVSSWNTTFDTVGSSSTDEQNWWAIAQHDYSAQRSDEVNFKRGQRIRVLRKESEKWWVGRLDDGRQGYIPANYVAISAQSEDVDSTFRSAKMPSTRENAHHATSLFTRPSQQAFTSDSEDEEIEE